MHQGNNNSDTSILYVVLSMIILVVIIFIFNKYGHYIKRELVSIVLIELEVPSLFSKEAEYVKSEIRRVHAEDLTFENVISQLHYAGKWYSLMVLPLYICLAIISWKLSVKDKYTRSLTMKTLLSNNIQHNPCIAPIVNWPISLLDENPDTGPWATAWQPIRFVAVHGMLAYRDGGGCVPSNLLLDAQQTANLGSNLLKQKQSNLVFDRSRAQAILVAQLGPKYQGVAALPAHLRKLATAFYLFGTDKKKHGQALLDEMSLTFRAPVQTSSARWSLKPPFYIPPCQGHGYLLDCEVSLDDKILCEIDCLVTHHDKYAKLAILFLYEFARRKGVLPTSEFIWLRPIDRQMFYLCNNVGRRTAWPEIAGAWAHYKVEEALAQIDGESKGVEEPQCVEAVNALEIAMFEEGWIDQLSEPAKRGMLENPDSR